MRHTNALIAGSLVLYLLVGQVSAAPVVSSVSGNVEHGESITIAGSGFGTHADYGGSQSFLCNGWQDFETGSLQGGNFTIGNLAVW